MLLTTQDPLWGEHQQVVENCTEHSHGNQRADHVLLDVPGLNYPRGPADPFRTLADYIARAIDNQLVNIRAQEGANRRCERSKPVQEPIDDFAVHPKGYKDIGNPDGWSHEGPVVELVEIILLSSAPDKLAPMVSLAGLATRL